MKIEQLKVVDVYELMNEMQDYSLVYIIYDTICDTDADLIKDHIPTEEEYEFLGDLPESLQNAYYLLTTKYDFVPGETFIWET